jgi:isoleucyl-tRNA synthetase
MKANLPQREPEMLAWWAQEKLYEQIQAAGQGRPRYVLHDGPPRMRTAAFTSAMR